MKNNQSEAVTLKNAAKQKEARMKLLVLTGLSVLLFFSCSTTKEFVFDDSIPIEQSAEVHIIEVGTVTGYNGIAVKWKPSNVFLTRFSVRIPAGDTLLEFDLNAYYFETIYKGKGILFRYNFLPHKHYRLYFAVEGGIYGLKVYTFEIGEEFERTWEAMKPNFTAFVPFLNNRGSQKTVLD